MRRYLLLGLTLLALLTAGCAELPWLLAGAGAGGASGVLLGSQKTEQLLADKSVPQVVAEASPGILAAALKGDWATTAGLVASLAYGLWKRNQLIQTKQTAKEEHIRQEIPPAVVKLLNGTTVSTSALSEPASSGSPSSGG